MPKIKALGLYAEKNNDFSCAIESCMKRSRKKPVDLTRKADISLTTHYDRLKHPGRMTIDELRVYANETNMPEEDILNAIYLRRGHDI